jgi:hypothetical protein
LVSGTRGNRDIRDGLAIVDRNRDVSVNPLKADRRPLEHERAGWRGVLAENRRGDLVGERTKELAGQFLGEDLSLRQRRRTWRRRAGRREMILRLRFIQENGPILRIAAERRIDRRIDQGSRGGRAGEKQEERTGAKTFQGVSLGHAQLPILLSFSRRRRVRKVGHRLREGETAYGVRRHDLLSAELLDRDRLRGSSHLQLIGKARADLRVTDRIAVPRDADGRRIRIADLRCADRILCAV